MELNQNNMKLYREQVKVNSDILPKDMRHGIAMFSDKHWFKYHACIAKNISIDAAIMFSVLTNLNSYWLSKSRVKKFISNKFYIQVDYDFIYNRIFLPKLRQKKATEELKRKHFLEIKHREGKRKWIKIDWEVVSESLTEWYMNMDDSSNEPIETEDINEFIDL